MARHALRWARKTETEIPQKCPDGHREHDPAIVRHKEKPADSKHASCQTHTRGGANRHDEEAVKHLYRIQCSLDQSNLLFLLSGALP